VRRLRQWLETLGEAFHYALDDNCFILAKAASYSAALALFPGLIFLAALLFRTDAEQTIEDISLALGHVLPQGVHRMLGDYLTVSEDRSTLVLVLAGIAAVLFAADLMSSLMEGFRAAYRVPRRSSMWVDYGVAILLVFLSIVPITAASAALVLSRQIDAWIDRVFNEPSWMIELTRAGWWTAALVMIVIVLAVLYYVAPNREQRWRDVLPGAVLAALLWAPMTALFTFYVQRIARYGEFYGSVSTVIVLLIWTYLGSVIVLLGCEFNAARERRLRMLPARGAPLEQAAA
jgi:membrane protein